MEDKQPESPEFAAFSPLESFQATANPTSNGLIKISDGRITGATKGPNSRDAALKHKFDEIDANDTILTLYVSGRVSESGQNKTASGDCVFFVFNTDNHLPLTKQDEFVVKKETFFYYKAKGSNVYHRSTFEQFKALSSQTDFDDTSSVQTGHFAARLFLLPN